MATATVEMVRVRSASDPTKSYDVKADGSFCSCPAWKWQKVPAAFRSCKHTVQVRKLVAA